MKGEHFMNFYPSLKEAKNLLNDDSFKNIAISCSFPAKKTSSEIFRILKNISRNVFILESAEDQENWGRYTFLGFNPSLELTCQNSKVKIKSGTTFTFEMYLLTLILDRLLPRTNLLIFPASLHLQADL